MSQSDRIDARPPRGVDTVLEVSRDDLDRAELLLNESVCHNPEVSEGLRDDAMALLDHVVRAKRAMRESAEPGRAGTSTGRRSEVIVEDIVPDLAERVAADLAAHVPDYFVMMSDEAEDVQEVVESRLSPFTQAV